MNRREFLSTLLGGAAVAYDPERLLWTPGKKLISIPKLVAPDHLTSRAYEASLDALARNANACYITAAEAYFESFQRFLAKNSPIRTFRA